MRACNRRNGIWCVIGTLFVGMLIELRESGRSARRVVGAQGRAQLGRW
jgi:hypothetical protein